MKVLPLASESLGVRSMATYVETDNLKIMIDPGIAIAPDRYKLEPTEIEFKTLRELRDIINKYCKISDVVIISHYHYYHYTPFFDDIYLESKDYAKDLYKDKILLIKHPSKYINESQKKRASEFLKNVKTLAKKIEYSDGREFKFDNTILKFSNPIPHGKDDKLGYVVMTLVKDKDFKFLHTSDIQGILYDEIKEFILKEKPNLIFLGGPPTYLMFRYGKKNLQKTNEALKEIISNIDTEIIIDHHLLRDKNFRKKIDIDFKTVAEYLGKENLLLEAYRKEIKAGKLWKI